MKSKNKKDKEFDSVNMMREIRDQLINIYKKHPQQEIEDLKNIRQKYQLKSSKKIKAL